MAQTKPAYFWKRYIEQLPEDITAYAVDAPGHGLSGGNYFNLVVYSQVVEQLLNRVGQVDAIVGHSLGGFSAIYTLARLPQFQPKKLAVLAMPGEVRVFWDQFYDYLKLSARTRIAIDDYCVQRLGGAPEYFSAIQFAKSLSLPGVLVYDSDDKEATVAYAKKVQAAWPQAQLVVTEGLGHNLRSDKVVEGITTFLQQPSAQPVA